MASIIRIKRSATSGNPGTLGAGELAYSSLADNGSNGGDRLYIGEGTETNGDAANHLVIGGKYFTDKLDHALGTLTASSAILVDASSKVNNLKVDNLDLDGNTISSTDTNGNVTINPNGTGTVDVSSSKIVNVTDPTADQDAATKKYVDDLTTAADLDFAGDTGTGDADISGGVLTIAGGTGLSSVASGQTLTMNLDNTAVTAGSYGSASNVPTFTVDAQGRLTAAGTATIATTLNVAGESGTGSVALADSSFTITGTGTVNTTMSGTTLSIAVDDATVSAKGLASFSTTNFTVSSGAVSSKDITIGSTALTLGETTATLAGLEQLDVDNIRLNGNVISTTDSASSLMTIDPRNNNAITGKVIIRGDLQVDGTQTTINSTTMTVDDLNLTLASGAADGAAANGAGLTIDGASATMLYDGTNDRFNFNKSVNVASGQDLMINGTGFNELVDDQVNTLLTAGTGITLTYDDAGGSLTVTGTNATVTTAGVALFDSDQFTVTSGLVSLAVVDGGTY